MNKNNLSCHHPEKLEFRNAKAHFQLFNDLGAFGRGWCSLRLYLLWIEGRASNIQSRARLDMTHNEPIPDPALRCHLASQRTQEIGFKSTAVSGSLNRWDR